MKKVNNLFNAGYGWGRTYPQKTRQKTRQKEESVDYSKEYLYFEALEDGMTISFKQINTSTRKLDKALNTLYYSTNKITWKTLSPEDESTEPINAGEKMYFKGNCVVNSNYSTYNVGIGTFVFSKECNVCGNVMSLLFEDDFVGKTDLTVCGGYAFFGLFNNAYYLMENGFDAQTYLIDAKNLILPATILSNHCYYGMFQGCTSLTTAPELPATTLADYCYGEIFSICTSLTTAPELPATTLAEGCYWAMFTGCTNLNYIKMLAPDISAYSCLQDWVTGISPTGTFVKAEGVEIPTGDSGIPSGWTVETA